MQCKWAVFGRVVVIGLEGVASKLKGVPIGLGPLDWGCGCWTSGCGIVPIGLTRHEMLTQRALFCIDSNTKRVSNL